MVHLAALDALGVRHGVVAVSRSDLADPAPMLARARDEVDRTTLRGAPVVPGVGLTSMAARAREVGGRLDIGPAESGGLRVMLVVPRRSA